MVRGTPELTRTDTLFPCTPLCRVVRPFLGRGELAGDGGHALDRARRDRDGLLLRLRRSRLAAIEPLTEPAFCTVKVIAGIGPLDAIRRSIARLGRRGNSQASESARSGAAMIGCMDKLPF